jgi:hypothetical protein
MAEFENGHCTGCGVRVRRWGHRPYCWRKVSMALDFYPTKKQIQWCSALAHPFAVPRAQETHVLPDRLPRGRHQSSGVSGRRVANVEPAFVQAAGASLVGMEMQRPAFVDASLLAMRGRACGTLTYSAALAGSRWQRSAPDA